MKVKISLVLIFFGIGFRNQRNNIKQGKRIFFDEHRENVVKSMECGAWGQELN
jgi:hypothetical protein